MILSIQVYTFFSRILDLMQSPAVKRSIAVVSASEATHR